MLQKCLFFTFQLYIYKRHRTHKAGDLCSIGIGRCWQNRIHFSSSFIAVPSEPPVLLTASDGERFMCGSKWKWPVTFPVARAALKPPHNGLPPQWVVSLCPSSLHIWCYFLNVSGLRLPFSSFWITSLSAQNVNRMMHKAAVQGPLNTSRSYWSHRLAVAQSATNVFCASWL